MAIPAGIVVTLTGWVVYRFRETRCLTLAQFFEVRYSRRFRIYAGFIVWISGLLNFGIFPYVASNFFVYFCGLPPDIAILGVSMPTFWPIMLITLGLAVVYTIVGGHITVMVTDCLQGIFVSAGLVLLSTFFLAQYSWTDLIDSMQAAPQLASEQEHTDKSIADKRLAKKLQEGTRKRLKYRWESSISQKLPRQLSNISETWVEAEHAELKARKAMKKAEDALEKAKAESPDGKIDRAKERNAWNAEADIERAKLELSFERTVLEQLLLEYELILTLKLAEGDRPQNDISIPPATDLDNTSNTDLRELLQDAASMTWMANANLEAAEEDFTRLRSDDTASRESRANAEADLENAKQQLESRKTQANDLFSDAASLMVQHAEQKLEGVAATEEFLEDTSAELRRVQADRLEAGAALSEKMAANELIIRSDSIGKSMLNPFDTGRVKDFSLLFFLIMVFNQFYGMMSWQGAQAYQSSGISPHEQKMSGIIFPWIHSIRLLGLVMLSICAISFLNDPGFAAQSADAHRVIEHLRHSDTPQLAVQQRVSIALGYMLPTGLRGVFCVMMVFLLITTQDTYMHSWGSIFIQDVIMPFRKTPLTPAQHVNLLRGSIIGVAVFACVFACLYKPTKFVQMYFAITGAVISGLGCAIIGGLYWKRGGTFAAYVAVGLGAILSITRIFVHQFKDNIAEVQDKGYVLSFIDYQNGINSQIIWLWIMVICIVSYIVLSLVAARKPFNLDRMLHRGEYDVKGDHKKASDALRQAWLKVVGIGEEFSRTDRFLALALVVWNFLWVAIFFGAWLYNTLVSPIPDEWWSTFWRVWLYIQVAVGIPATLWFIVGGIRDMRGVFHRLRTLPRDETDDGRVVGHHLPGDVEE